MKEVNTNALHPDETVVQIILSDSSFIGDRLPITFVVKPNIGFDHNERSHSDDGDVEQ